MPPAPPCRQRSRGRWSTAVRARCSSPRRPAGRCAAACARARQPPARRRSAGSSSATTGRPSTSSSSSGAAEARTPSAATGSSPPAWPRPSSAPDRHVGELARLQRAELVGAAEAAGAADGGQPQRLAGGQRGRAAAQPGHQSSPSAARPRAGRPRWRPSRPPRGRPARRPRAGPATRALPAPSRRVGRRAVRHRGAGPGEAGDRRVASRCTQCASQTSVAEPAQLGSAYSAGVQP